MTAEGSSHPHIVPITHMGDKDEMQMLFGKVRSVCSDCRNVINSYGRAVASDGANWIVI